MFLKRRVRHKDGKEHVYYAVSESLRVHGGRTTRDGRTLTLPRITIPEKEQAALLLQLGWTLPAQPPPRIRSPQLPPPA